MTAPSDRSNSSLESAHSAAPKIQGLRVPLPAVLVSLGLMAGGAAIPAHADSAQADAPAMGATVLAQSAIGNDGAGGPYAVQADQLAQEISNTYPEIAAVPALGTLALGGLGVLLAATGVRRRSKKS